MLRVLVIDPVAKSRKALGALLTGETDIVVVSMRETIDGAVREIRIQKPDLLAIDARALEADHGAINQIMSETPLPILLLVDETQSKDDSVVVQALRQGVLAVLQKPSSHSHPDCAELCGQIRSLAKIPVVRHPAAARSRRQTPPAMQLSSLPKQSPGPPRRKVIPEVVGIGSSAGGPQALTELLSALPCDFPGCVLVVQHLPRGFASPFADFLRAGISLPVQLATPGLQMVPGQVILAPDDAHLVVEYKGYVGLNHTGPVLGHRPSVDKLLLSLAKSYGSAAVGVILSGIGSDGTAGLSAIREAGGLTFAQTGESSAVNGMPRSASESGAAMFCQHPSAIADSLCFSFAKEKVQDGSR